MRHRVRGRILSRDSSHRQAMLRNLAASLIRSVEADEDEDNKPQVPGRIVTTVAKAKELRPFVEKLVTTARKAIAHERNAEAYATSAERNTAEWQRWRQSEQWNQWNQAIAPAVALRRRAFDQLRDKEAVRILFDDIAHRFEDRPGGYTRIVQLPEVRLGDAGRKALIEFVGQRDRIKSRRRPAPVVTEPEEGQETTTTESPSSEAAGTADTSQTASESAGQQTGQESAAAEEQGEPATEEDSKKQSE